MATVSTIQLQNEASFVVVRTTGFPTPTKSVILSTIQTNNIGKVIYIKEITGGGNPFFLSTARSNVISGISRQTVSTLQISSLEAYTLQVQTSTTWAVLNKYTNIGQFDTRQNPPAQPLTTIVNPNIDTSCLFVDLRTQSKTLVLPPLLSLSWSNRVSPFLTVKDLYGNAFFSSLYLSTNTGDLFDNGSSNLGLYNPYGSLDLMGDASNRRWNVVGFYSGSKVIQ